MVSREWYSVQPILGTLAPKSRKKKEMFKTGSQSYDFGI
jgi:hypothetical protein